jgi:hypothetical protein
MVVWPKTSGNGWERRPELTAGGNLPICPHRPDIRTTREVDGFVAASTQDARPSRKRLGSLDRLATRF